MRFDVVYVDPPWLFRNEKTGGSHTSGAVQKYPVMELGQIVGLPVPSIVSHSAVLFLWVPTALKYSHAPAVAHGWGFRHYITTAYWDKQKLGMGFWFRNAVEELTVWGTSYEAVAPFGCQMPNIIHQPPGEHSTKPEAFRQLIEKATGKISRRQCVELFARRVVPGWTGAGNILTRRDIREDIRLLAQAEQEGIRTWPTLT